MKNIEVKSLVLRGVLNSVKLHGNILFVHENVFQSAARHCILGTTHLLTFLEYFVYL